MGSDTVSSLPLLLAAIKTWSAADEAVAMNSSGNPDWPAVIHARAERMRRNPTRAETELWRHLKNRPQRHVFWHQHVIAWRFIADFYCPAAQLVIEVDGDIHTERRVEDDFRDNVMHNLGLRVLRFSNLSVLADAESVLDRILQVIDDPRVFDAQRAHEAARRSALVRQAKVAAEVRQRPVGTSRKSRFRCTWCLADFIAALAPAPACRRCLVSRVVAVCGRCALRQCHPRMQRCRTCVVAGTVARAAVGAHAEPVNRNSRHRVRKIL